jgi:signal transduction histidine kinase
VFEETDLVELLNRAVTTCQDAAEQRDIRVVLEVPEKLPIHTNPELLSSVLENLVGNAVAYSATGSRVLVRLSLFGNEAVVAVENPAPGLVDSDVTHMFEPFWRKSESRNDSAIHTGMGLTIAAMMCQLLGISLRPVLVDGVLQMTLSIPVVR